jgi:LuxR family transcriptional regulator, maltose regulon positive regulatory protein
MESTLLVTRTRIIVPRRRTEILSRQRLLDELLELMDARLIIVAAPAGYGKTSLLIDFVHHLEWPVCWYALDPLDQDPLRFVAHFVAALNLRFPQFGEASKAMLTMMAQDRLNLDMLISTVINDAYENITEHFALVLDDYHLVDESKLVNQFVSRFIQDSDENCHVIIASRVLISLPDMPLLVARSQVGGLSFEELTFRPEEIQALLLQNQHQTISEKTARDLVRQTEGWITGLLLSTELYGQGVSDRQTLNRVSGVGLYEYLTNQVFSRQPPAIQDFLLRTSLLEEFDADFCAEVIDNALDIKEDWEELMETATHNNLFILPVEDERVWLRYHHLFSDFLQNRVQRERPDEAEKIQLRLAEVFAARSQWEQVYRLYQRLGKLDAIANLIEEAGLFMVTGGRLNTLSNWLVALPEKVIAERPALLSIQGSVAVMRGDSRRGLALFDQSIEMLSKTGIGSQMALTLVRRSGAHRLLGEYAQALADAETALWTTGNNPDLASIRAEACRAKGVALYQQGQLKEGLTWLAQSEAAFRALDDRHDAAKVLMEIGIVYKASANFSAAEQAYLGALEYWESTSNSVWQANLLNNLGVLQHMRGDYVTAASTFERAIQHARIGSYPRLEAFSLASIGDMYRDLEAPSEAMEAYHQARQISQRIKDRFLLFYLDLAEGVLLRTQKQLERCGQMLDSARQMAGESGSRAEQNLCRMELAVLELLKKDLPAAANGLESALGYFEQEGQLVEAARSHLYLAAVYQAQKEVDKAGRHLAQLARLATESERLAPLVATGRELGSHLHQLQKLPAPQGVIRDLAARVEEFGQKLSTLRNQVRRRASVVPFAPPRMTIRALGKIEVKIADRLVTNTDWQTLTARDLFFFILDHREGVSKDAIGLAFWQEASASELRLRFKNSVYRLRHAAGRDVIVLKDDIYYHFNTDIDYEYDVEIFLKDIDMFNQAEDVHARIAYCKSAIQSYRGPYLPEVEQTWAVAERERLYQIYIDALLKLSGIQLEIRQYEGGLEACQLMLREDASLEAAHRTAMRIHAAMGNRAAVVRQYELCRQALNEEYEAAPSPQTEQLYAILTR